MKKLNYLLSGVLCLATVSFCLAQTPDAPNGKKWVSVQELSDEFNENTIDENKWFDYHPHWAGRPPSKFKKGNAFVDGDGYLKLRSTLMKDPSTVNNPLSDIWVNAAACVSKEKSAKPGYYYEARFKASSLSMTSSFWFRVGQFSEIDVIEHIGNPSRDDRQDDLPYEYAANTHYYGPHNGLDNKKKTWRMPVRGRDGFHTYGFWWKNPNQLLFYYDGQQVMEIVPRVPLDENLKMIFDTEVFPFAQAGVPNIGLPKVENLNDDSMNTMLVDWVRVYKLEDDDGTGDVQSAFTSHKIPGTIQAEDFDNGGQGLAYNDADATNNGGEGRTDQGVDIEATTDEGGGTNVGWISNGEWLEYTIEDVNPGTYDVNFRMASNNADPKSIKAFLGNKDLGTITVGDTGGWQSWQNFTIPNVEIDDATSNQILRLEMTVNGASYNVNWISFIESTLSVADVDIVPFKIYPNPSNGEITIELKDNTKELSLIIYDVTGRQILSRKLDSEKVKLSNLPSGIYWAQLNNGNSRTLKKIILL